MMSKTDARPGQGDGHLSCDLLIVGAGIVGLWLARLAVDAGLQVIILEKRTAGSGASGGILGALMPHMPERWNPKKQFQFEALASLAGIVRELEDETGVDCGYRRCGRLMPLAKPHQRALAEERKAAVAQVWATVQGGFDWNVLDAAPSTDWPSEKAMPNGMVHETLAARISPRRYLAALRASVDGPALLIEGEGLRHWDTAARAAVTTKGRVVSAGRTVLTAGHETFLLLGELLNMPARSMGRPVKGQAALLRTDVADDLPLVFSDGVYLVPHEGGRVAVGSTSEMEFGDGQATDAKLDDLIGRAGALCPAIEGAPVTERWAGLRPKAVRRDPMIGPVPGCEALFVATGGFKITFGIAHKMAQSALQIATTGACRSLPSSFRVEAHLEGQLPET